MHTRAQVYAYSLMNIYFIYFSNHRTNRFSQLPVRFDVVPRLLIEAQRSIELQATGVGPFHPSFRHSPTLPASRPSTLYSFLCFLPSVTLYITYNIYIYIYLTLSFHRSGEGRTPSEFHFRPITIHPGFKAAVHAALISAAKSE